MGNCADELGVVKLLGVSKYMTTRTVDGKVVVVNSDVPIILNGQPALDFALFGQANKTSE